MVVKGTQKHSSVGGWCVTLESDLQMTGMWRRYVCAHGRPTQDLGVDAGFQNVLSSSPIYIKAGSLITLEIAFTGSWCVSKYTGILNVKVPFSFEFPLCCPAAHMGVASLSGKMLRLAYLPLGVVGFNETSCPAWLWNLEDCRDSCFYCSWLWLGIRK